MSKQYAAPPAMTIDPAKDYRATIATTRGLLSSVRAG